MSVGGRVVVITGATGLLGPAVARAFAAAGARVALLARDRAALEAVAATLPGPAERRIIVPADLGSAESAEQAAETVRNQLGPADALLHLVGKFRGGTVLRQTPETDWDFLYEVNVRSAARAIAAFMPQLIAGGRGRIVAVSSPFAQSPTAMNAAYAAAKAALEALILSVARELAEHDATANIVVVRSIKPDTEGVSGGARTGTTPEELAAAMLWLCSDEARTVTGARLPLHGGTR